MRIKINSKDFISGINRIKGILGLKNILPVFRKFLIHADSDGVRMMTTDSFLTTLVNLDCKVEEEGKILINPPYLLNILDSLGDEVLIYTEENKCVIDSANLHWEWNLSEMVNYPDIPVYDVSNAIELDAKEFAKALDFTGYLVSADRTMFMTLEIEAGLFYSSDGFRIGSYQSTLKDLNMRLTKESVDILHRLNIKNVSDMRVEIKDDDKSYIFYLDGVLFVARQISTQFPRDRVMQRLNAKSEHRFRLNKKELFRIVHGLSMPDSRAIDLTASKKTLTLISKDVGGNIARGEMLVDSTDDMTVSIKNSFLLETLAVLKEDVIDICLYPDKNDVICVQEDSYKVIIFQLLQD